MNKLIDLLKYCHPEALGGRLYSLKLWIREPRLSYHDSFVIFSTTLIFILIIFPLSLLPAEEVRIGIFSKYSLSEIELNIEDARIFFGGKDKTLKKGTWKVKLVGNGLHLFNKDKAFQGGHILLRTGNGFSISIEDNGKKLTRSYKGILELYAIKKKMQLVLTIPLEEYISSSTYSELGELLFANKFPNETSKNELIATQEIVIRTYILKEKKRHADEKFDFCDLTHCIYFAGAIDKLSLYPGVILSGKSSTNGYFHSTCGGHLSGPEVFWSKHSYSSHYRRGLDGEEPNCKDSPHFEWETMLSMQEIEEIVEMKNLVSIQTLRKNERVYAIKTKNTNQDTSILPISTLFSKTGKLHGWNKIKSNDFTLEKKGSMVLIKGRGLGHGIGMCQWGAASLAAKGKSHQEILEFYFPGIDLKKW